MVGLLIVDHVRLFAALGAELGEQIDESAARQMPCSVAAPWRIGVDVGGTFTDMVLRDAAGAVRIFKAPSVPADPSEGVLGVLRLAAQQLDITLTALLRDCVLFVHGSTVATNTILEKKGARSAC